MIDLEIEPDAADGYVLRVRDGANHDVLLSTTSQSYANEADVERLAKRLFASPAVWSGVVGIDPPFTEREPFGLSIRFREGGSRVGFIRRGIGELHLVADIEPDAAGGYVLRVVTNENGDVLLSSTSQSYANVSDADDLALRLFGLASYGPDGTPEPVRLTVVYRTGATKTERIR